MYNRKYQKCPVCDGTGLVSKPPWVAGDAETWISSSTGPWTCQICGGTGLILEPPYIEDQNSLQEGSNSIDDQWDTPEPQGV